MQANFSDSFWELLRLWYKRPHNFNDPDFDVETETKMDCQTAYALGVKDGKTELAHDIFEHLGLINYN